MSYYMRNIQFNGYFSFNDTHHDEFDSVYQAYFNHVCFSRDCITFSLTVDNYSFKEEQFRIVRKNRKTFIIEHPNSPGISFFNPKKPSGVVKDDLLILSGHDPHKAQYYADIVNFLYHYFVAEFNALRPLVHD